MFRKLLECLGRFQRASGMIYVNQNRLKSDEYPYSKKKSGVFLKPMTCAILMELSKTLSAPCWLQSLNCENEGDCLTAGNHSHSTPGTKENKLNKPSHMESLPKPLTIVRPGNPATTVFCPPDSCAMVRKEVCWPRKLFWPNNSHT